MKVVGLPIMPNDNRQIIYEIKRKRNCKNLIIKIIHNKVVVTAPPHLKIKEIERFVSKKQEWILDNLTKTETNFADFLQQTEFLLFGQKYALVYVYTERKHIKIRLQDDGIHIFLNKQTTDEQVKKAMKNFLRKEAEHYFESCLLALRERIDVFPIIDQYLEHWRIRYMKSAYGLCYAQRKEIVLNTELVLYAEKYVNYVILHELSHFFHQNHSAAFYAVFEKLEPQWKQYKKELNVLHKQYGGWSYI